MVSQNTRAWKAGYLLLQQFIAAGTDPQQTCMPCATLLISISGLLYPRCPNPGLLRPYLPSPVFPPPFVGRLLKVLPSMASARYASYLEEEDWDIPTLQLVNSHLEKYLRMVGAGS
ncbi:hypothetical protein BaRGS_00035082 [Batillaria attramentaria]|uniref:Uncharacterized protein n=1 Tax=Batillaria attramentaria TaxID=370345 RepID=A0ABD0JFM8_9CAEN